MNNPGETPCVVPRKFATRGRALVILVSNPRAGEQYPVASPNGRTENPLRPPAPPMSDVTRILSAIEQGDPQAAEQLLPLVYEELRKLAAHRLAQEMPGQTLQAT